MISEEKKAGSCCVNAFCMPTDGDLPSPSGALSTSRAPFQISRPARRFSSSHFQSGLNHSSQPTPANWVQPKYTTMARSFSPSSLLSPSTPTAPRISAIQQNSIQGLKSVPTIYKRSPPPAEEGRSVVWNETESSPRLLQ